MAVSFSCILKARPTTLPNSCAFPSFAKNVADIPPVQLYLLLTIGELLMAMAIVIPLIRVCSFCLRNMYRSSRVLLDVCLKLPGVY